MGLWTTYKAVFYDDKGEQIKVVKFNPRKDNFKISNMNKSFLVDLKNGSKFVKTGWVKDIRYYFYPIKSPHPLSFSNKSSKLILDSDMFNTQLESKVARDLNRLSDNTLTDLLTTKNIIIGSIVLFAVYLLATGKLNSLIGG